MFYEEFHRSSITDTSRRFNVDDVDAEYKRLLSQGAQMLNKPTTHPRGARSFQFKDPDGNILNFPHYDAHRNAISEKYHHF